MTDGLSSNQLTAFAQALRSDPALQKRLRAAKGVDEIAALVKEAGFGLAIDEDFIASLGMTNDLTDQELERVAGGSQQGCFNAQTCTKGNESCKQNTIQDTPYRLDC